MPYNVHSLFIYRKTIISLSKSLDSLDSFYNKFYKSNIRIPRIVFFKL